ncbi:ATP-binding SpoIIE family protein phosphatase [Streptomyces sp. NBC_01353]|uniref:ATP-binding SpoIIE family protein phosphatase n=1 Tax=Streptomyces sp. NBC_01353 TaxID=2903835 RepID=UPI002E3752B1|nr:SpoIIE family protein phosphatase [Streptomyces sp. NBC_01353]
MDFTADSLVSRAARELSLRADQLIQDVERALRRDVPEVWAHADVDAAQNVAEHVLAALDGLERGIEPNRIESPSANQERARRLARHGTPVSVMLRAFRIGQGVVLDGMLVELPRLTGDAALVSAAARKLIATMTGYVDLASEYGVAAYQEERDRRLQGRLSMVNEASMRIGTTLDIARTTQELADFAIAHFADLVTVDLLDSVLRGHDTPMEPPLALRRAAQRSVVDGAPETTIRPQQLFICADGTPSARALITGRPSRHHLDTGGSATSEPGTGVDGDASHSTLVVPLRARDSTLGVAQFVRHRDRGFYDDEDLLLAQEIAARAAVAVDNARRYTHARAAALTLQRSLLPHDTAEQSAVEVAFRYLPAGAQAGVGGDWYDVIPLSGARVALVVGDVVGHGIHAAATMGRLRTAVRTLADVDLPPDELLTHLDDVVLRLSAEAVPDAAPDGEADPDADLDADADADLDADSDEGADQAGDSESAGDIGATCLYAVYDPVTRQCTLARAGHPPPALVAPDGTVEILDLPPGPPLGLGGLPFEAAEFDLPEGSLLALYTDGLIEARDRDIETGLALLRRTLAQPAPSLEHTCDSVLEALLPPRPDDDVALLIARTRTLGDRQFADWDVEAEPAAVSKARSNVTRQLSSWGLEELAFTAELVVSELVTNAIRYGRPPIRLRLIHDRALMCEVSDTSSTTPHLRRAAVSDEGGRGLFLVAQLAERWGTRHARQGKTVWAELSESAGFPVWDSV